MTLAVQTKRGWTWRCPRCPARIDSSERWAVETVARIHLNGHAMDDGDGHPPFAEEA